MRSLLYLAVLALLFSQNGQASILATNWELRQIDSVTIHVHDQVRGRCFLNHKAVENRARVRLAQSGIAIDSNSKFSILLSFVGMNTENKSGTRTGCAASYYLKLTSYDQYSGTALFAYHHGIVISGETLDADLMVGTESFIDEILSHILTAKQKTDQNQSTWSTLP